MKTRILAATCFAAIAPLGVGAADSDTWSMTPVGASVPATTASPASAVTARPTYTG